MQETLEVQAILECIKLKEGLEDSRKKMMKKIKMTPTELDTLRPSRNSNVKDIFEESEEQKSSGGAISSYETQKDIVELVSINEMLTNFLAKKTLPRFRAERIHNYKKILTQFSKMERMNSKNLIVMWQSVMKFHSERGEEGCNNITDNKQSVGEI